MTDPPVVVPDGGAEEVVPEVEVPVVVLDEVPELVLVELPEPLEVPPVEEDVVPVDEVVPVPTVVPPEPATRDRMNVSMRLPQPNELSDPKLPSHGLENNIHFPSLEICAKL